MTIRSASDALALLAGYRFKRQEHFGVICLDSGYNVIAQKVLFKGGSSVCNVDLKVLFWEVCKKNACAVIIFHNHPSGNVQPSDYDIKTTSYINKGCNTLGIQLLDHVIIGKFQYFSFKEYNMIESESEIKAVAENK